MREGTFCTAWRLLRVVFLSQVGGDLAWGVQKGFGVPGGTTSPQRRKKWAGEDVSYHSSNPASFTVRRRPSRGETHTAEFQRWARATKTQAYFIPMMLWWCVAAVVSILRWAALYFRRIYRERSGLEDSAEGRETERSVCFQSNAPVDWQVSLTSSVPSHSGSDDVFPGDSLRSGSSLHAALPVSTARGSGSVWPSGSSVAHTNRTTGRGNARRAW